jgi:uncharacterized membrane protein
MTTMKKLLICVTLILFIVSISPASPALSAEAVVRAVLFFSPACGHCHLVITEVLPPLFQQYGSQLQVVGVDVTQPDGQALFMAALDYFKIEYGGVPLLVVGDTYLIGSVDIPQQFHGLIEKYLAQGGVDWPVVPGLAEAMRSAQPTEAALPAETTPTGIAAAAGVVSPDPGSLPAVGLEAKFAQDLVGNSLAVIVLVGMIVVLGASFFVFRRAPRRSFSARNRSHASDWLVLLLCVTGLGVAGYLAFVEATRVQAVCGPVGDCNTVQQSEYALLFGVIPIGLLGMLGYVLILIAWVIAHSANRRRADYAALAQLGMTVLGVFFSIYLTFLEPFVIGATCAWCLTSALIMTALLWLSLTPARLALSSLLYGVKYAHKRSDSQRAF